MSYIQLSDKPPSGSPESLPAPSKEELDIFYSALGEAVAAWQMIESLLAITFAYATRTQNNTAVLAAFHAISGFRNRLAMVTSAIKQSTNDKKILEEWEKLEEKLIKKSKKRNNIAHSIVLFDPEQEKDKRLFLINGVFDPNKVGIKEIAKAKRLYSKELLEAANSFRILTNPLSTFSIMFPQGGG